MIWFNKRPSFLALANWLSLNSSHGFVKYKEGSHICNQNKLNPATESCFPWKLLLNSSVECISLIIIYLLTYLFTNIVSSQLCIHRLCTSSPYHGISIQDCDYLLMISRWWTAFSQGLHHKMSWCLGLGLLDTGPCRTLADEIH